MGGNFIWHKSSLKCGISTYRVVPVYFANRDADEVFRELEKKRSSEEMFTEADFARLSLTPLMAGSLSRKETIKKSHPSGKTGQT